MLDLVAIQRIGALVLHHEPRVTTVDAAGFLASRAKMNSALRNGEIEVVETWSGKRVELRELAGTRCSSGR